jgi:hypothetical protein
MQQQQPGQRMYLRAQRPPNITPTEALTPSAEWRHMMAQQQAQQGGPNAGYRGGPASFQQMQGKSCESLVWSAEGLTSLRPATLYQVALNRSACQVYLIMCVLIRYQVDLIRCISQVYLIASDWPYGTVHIDFILKADHWKQTDI